MKFTLETLAEAFFLKYDDSGRGLEGIQSELKGTINSGDKLSVILDMKAQMPNKDVLIFCREVVGIVKSYNGILVVTGVKDSSKFDFGEAVYLPTFHEAKEAIFMNDLENQFLNEMGDA